MIILEKDKIKLNKFSKINNETITVNDVKNNTIINAGNSRKDFIQSYSIKNQKHLPENFQKN